MIRSPNLLSSGWKKCVLIIAIGVFVLGGLRWQIVRHREPIYKGKRLTDWLREYDAAQPGVTFKEVDEAVRQIGTNALPQLLHLLRAKDTPLKLFLIRSAGKQHLVGVDVSPAAILHGRALAAFRTLGPSAKPALPALQEILCKENYAYVMAVIAGFGKDGFELLVNELTNKLAEVRCYAAYELSMTNFASCPAGAALAKSLNDKDPDVRCAAAMSLGRIAREPDVSIAALIDALTKDSNSQVRVDAAFALGRYGNQAEKAIPVLKKALKDEDKKVRDEAAFSLRQIEADIAVESIK